MFIRNLRYYHISRSELSVTSPAKVVSHLLASFSFQPCQLQLLIDRHYYIERANGTTLDTFLFYQQSEVFELPNKALSRYQRASRYSHPVSLSMW
jgi:hypothetical protein